MLRVDIYYSSYCKIDILLKILFESYIINNAQFY